MFLIGLVVGIIMTVVSNASITGIGGKRTTAPTAPSQPQVESATDKMLSVIKSIGLSEDAFTACTKDDGGAIVQKINQIEADGQKAGIRGTPGNIIYSVKAKKGRIVSGARPAEMFKTHIDAYLKNPNAKLVADPNDSSLVETTAIPPIDPATDYIMGNKDATVAIIEYSDYQCPYCHRVHPTLKQLVSDYGDKVMWVFRHYPLPPNMHPDALPLAIGAECAAKLGGNDAFWQYTDAIMSSN